MVDVRLNPPYLFYNTSYVYVHHNCLIHRYYYLPVLLHFFNLLNEMDMPKVFPMLSSQS